jgi:hypothetical protein
VRPLLRARYRMTRDNPQCDGILSAECTIDQHLAAPLNLYVSGCHALPRRSAIRVVGTQEGQHQPRRGARERDHPVGGRARVRAGVQAGAPPRGRHRARQCMPAPALRGWWRWRVARRECGALLRRRGAEGGYRRQDGRGARWQAPRRGPRAGARVVFLWDHEARVTAARSARWAHRGASPM